MPENYLWQRWGAVHEIFIQRLVDLCLEVAGISVVACANGRTSSVGVRLKSELMKGVRLYRTERRSCYDIIQVALFIKVSVHLAN